MNSEKETAVKESYVTPNTTWFNGMKRLFFLRALMGIQCEAGRGCQNETTYFKSAGAKVQVQTLKIKNKFVTNHLL